MILQIAIGIVSLTELVILYDFKGIVFKLLRTNTNIIFHIENVFIGNPVPKGQNPNNRESRNKMEDEFMISNVRRVWLGLCIIRILQFRKIFK